MPSNTGTRDWYVHVRKGAPEFTEPEILGLLPRERTAEPEPEPEPGPNFDPILMCDYTGETEGPYADSAVYTFLNIFTVDEEANYIYRRYNASTNAFSAAYDSTIDKTAYGIDQVYTEGKSVIVVYYNNSTNDLIVHIVTSDGSVVQELSYDNASHNISVSRNLYAHVYIDVSDNLQGVLYDQTADAFDTFQIDNVSSISRVIAFNEHTVFLSIQHPADSVSYRAYRYSYGTGGTATELFAANSITIIDIDSPTHIAGAYEDPDVSFVEKLFILYQSSMFSTYDVSGGIYNVLDSGVFGVNNSMYWLKLSNNDTSLIDYHIIDAVTDASGGFAPAILRNIRTTLITRLSNNNYKTTATGASNNFAIFLATPVMTFISDGGSDMFDNGNYVSFSIDGTETANIQYGTLVEESTYGYYVGEGSPYPHLSIAYADSAALQWRTSGNLGADGSGTISNSTGTYTCSGGRHGSYWLNTTRGAGDPAVGDLWFTIEKTEWSSNISSTTDNRKVSNTDSYNHNMIATGTNFFFCKALLSRGSGQNINTAEVETFLQNYVENMDIMSDPDDFSTTDLSGFTAWYIANSSSYISAFTNWFSYAYDGGVLTDKTNGVLHVYFEENADFSDAIAVTDVFKNSIAINDDTIGYTKELSGDLICVLISSEGTTEITLGTDESFINCNVYNLHRRFLYRFRTTSDTLSRIFAVNTSTQLAIGDISGDTSDNFTIEEGGRYAMTRLFGADETNNYLFTGCEFVEISGSFLLNNVSPDFGLNCLYAFDTSSMFVIAMSPDGYRQQILLETTVGAGGDITRIA